MATKNETKVMARVRSLIPENYDIETEVFYHNRGKHTMDINAWCTSGANGDVVWSSVNMSTLARNIDRIRVYHWSTPTIHHQDGWEVYLEKVC